jgi:lysophospholipase L1-like esterase
VNGPQLSADAGIQRPLEVRNCDIEGGIRGTGVSGEFQDYGGNPDPGIDPHFLLQPPNATYNPAGTDGKYFTSDDGFRLQATSPLRDKGRNDPWYPDITAATDMAGAKRVQAYNVDMGAFEATDARKPILLMPLGNSITAGLGDGAVGTRPEDYRDDLGKGYREPLWRLFPVDFVGNSIEVHKTDRGPFSPTDPDLPWPPPDWDVDHMGFPGSGISGIADMFTSYAAGSDMEYGTADDWVFPDVVLLLAGTNDIRQPKVGVTPNDVPVALDKLNEFIELLLEKSPDRNGDGIADVMILVGTIPEFLPDQYFTWRWGEGDVATTKSVSYNAGLMTLPAIVNNANVQLVDIAAAVGSNMSPGKPREGEHTGDGVHPNMIGYEAMANAWYGALMDAGVAESP